MAINECIVHSQSVLLSQSVCVGFICKDGFCLFVFFASLRSSFRGTLYVLYLSIFLARGDGAVNEKGQGTLRDAYKNKCAM